MAMTVEKHWFFSYYLVSSSMSLQDTDKNELQKKGEDDSMAWQTYAVKKLVVLESVIQEMVQQKDTLPNQLLDAADIILKMLSGINVIILRLCSSVCTNNTFPFSR